MGGGVKRTTDLSAILARIEARLEKVGISANAASQAAGKPDCIRNMRRAVADGNRKGVTVETVAALAKPLETSTEWLLSGRGEEELQHNATSSAEGPLAISRVGVVGVTQAGAWFEYEDFEDAAYEGVDIPAVPGQWAHLPQFAYQVRGSSMNADGIVDGSYVVCVRYFDARSDIKAGDRVVIERRRSSSVERTVKQVEVDGATLLFVPRSTDARHQPIAVPLDHGSLREADDTEIAIVGLVIGNWRPFT